jgi:uroporphyrinogen decarboxylase
VKLALEHRETDRLPIGMVCSGINPAARSAFDAWLRRDRGIGATDFLAPLLDIQGVGPRYIGPTLPAHTDFWGVRRRAVSYGDGAYEEIEHHPLASAEGVADLAAHPWPRLEWFDFEAVVERCAALDRERERALMASNGNIFETSWYLRGFENIFFDLVEDPDFVQELLTRVTDFYVGYFERLLSAAKGRIDLVFTADDIAGQEGLLMSLPMWERALKPHHARLNRALHAFGVKVIYHSDGAVTEAVPGLVDMGIDVLQALQFDAAGMDPDFLKDRFGDRLSFCGGVSVQRTLPFGTPEEVRREVGERKRILGKNGGYILGPSHCIQDGTPPENIAAFFDEAVRA